MTSKDKIQIPSDVVLPSEGDMDRLRLVTENITNELDKATHKKYPRPVMYVIALKLMIKYLERVMKPMAVAVGAENLEVRVKDAKDKGN